MSPKDEFVKVAGVRTEVVYDGMIWNINKDTFDYNGVELRREYVAHPGAVAVLAFNEKDEILLIKQYRHPVRQKLWELPAGLLDIAGESKEAAAARELLEETGYVAGRMEFLTEFYTTPGGNNETIWIYQASELKFEGHDFVLEGEETDLEVCWVAFEDALASVLAADMKSPSATVGIMAAALKRRNS